MVAEENGRPPTFTDVEGWEESLAELRERAEQVRARLQRSWKALGTKMAEGGGEAAKAVQLREERGTLRDEQEELWAALPILTRQMKHRTEAEALRARFSLPIPQLMEIPAPGLDAGVAEGMGPMLLWKLPDRLPPGGVSLLPGVSRCADLGGGRARGGGDGGA